MSLSPGETVVVQEVWHDRVWAARPMTVVHDEESFVALWFPKGARWKRPTAPPSRLAARPRAVRLARCLTLGDWMFENAEWDVSTLTLMRAGDWHAVWVSWLEDGSHCGWYVNLQKPYLRTAKGFETMDLVLDVVIDVDRRWRWKDEDELEVFVAAGVLAPPLTERMRAEGRRVARRAEQNEPPFDDSWLSWRPDPSWARPELPDDWEAPCR